MTTYKLTVNLDATLAVQNENGSYNYFKPSIGAEITTDETDDLTILNKKFEDLYAEVIGPNFSAVVKEFLINSNEEEKPKEVVEDDKKCTCDTSDSCDCKPLEIRAKNESDITHYDAATLLPISDVETLPKEEWE